MTTTSVSRVVVLFSRPPFRREIMVRTTLDTAVPRDVLTDVMMDEINHALGTLEASDEAFRDWRGWYRRLG